SGRCLDPHVLAIPDAAIVGILGIDLDEVLLLQLGKPLVRTRLLAAAFVLDQSAGSKNQREVLGDILLEVVLLHRLVQRRQPPERLLVIVRWILLDEIGTWPIQRLAVLRNAVRELPDDGARLGDA